MKKIFIIFATLFALNAAFADRIGMSIGGGFKSSFYTKNLENENIPKILNKSVNMKTGLQKDVLAPNIAGLGVFIKFDIFKDYQTPKAIIGWSIANEVSFQNGTGLDICKDYVTTSNYIQEKIIIYENIESYTLFLTEYRVVPFFMTGNKTFKVGLGIPVTFSFDTTKMSGRCGYFYNWNSVAEDFMNTGVSTYDSSAFTFYQGIGLRPQIEFCVKRFKIGGFFEFNGSLYQIKHLNKKYTKEADICSENSTTLKFFPKNSIKMSVGIYTTFIL